MSTQPVSSASSLSSSSSYEEETPLSVRKEIEEALGRHDVFNAVVICNLSGISNDDKQDLKGLIFDYYIKNRNLGKAQELAYREKGEFREELLLKLGQKYLEEKTFAAAREVFQKMSPGKERGLLGQALIAARVKLNPIEEIIRLESGEALLKKRRL